jgi:hypothetical protein
MLEFIEFYFMEVKWQRWREWHAGDKKCIQNFSPET